MCKVGNETTETIFTNLEIKGDGEQKFNTMIRVATDTGVGKTILNRTDWFKIADECRMVKTRVKFRPWGTDHDREDFRCDELGDGEGGY